MFIGRTHRQLAGQAVARQACRSGRPIPAHSHPHNTIRPPLAAPHPTYLSQIRSFAAKLNLPTPPPRQKTPRMYDPTKEDPATIKPKETLSYDVPRIKLSGWLPIYRDYKHSRTQVSTRIRHVKGDATALVDDLAGKVAPRHRISIKKTSGDIVLLGDYLHDLRDFFTVRGF